MKLVRAFVIVGWMGIFTSLCGCGRNQDPRSDVAAATVFMDRCRFFFPVENVRRTWKWGVTKANTCEYAWMLKINVDHEVYELGFSFFNHDVIERIGTLAELMSVGQTNMWLISGQGGATYVEGVTVNGHANEHGLTFVLDDEELLDRLFRSRPTNLRFERTGAMLAHAETEVRVEYRLEDRTANR